MDTYVELHCHSYYSFLDGASSPEELVQRAAALDMPALAITDHDGLYGAVEFWRAARNASSRARRGAGVHPIIGAEMTLDDGSHLTLLAETQAGYSNLCRLISRAQLAGQKLEPVLISVPVTIHILFVAARCPALLVPMRLTGPFKGHRLEAGTPYR